MAVDGIEMVKTLDTINLNLASKKLEVTILSNSHYSLRMKMIT